MKKTPQNTVSFFVGLTASIAAIAGILFGFDTGVISGAILFIRDEFHLTPALNGLLVSAVLIGALIGSAISGRFADYLGRKKLLIFTAVLFLLSTLASTISLTILQLFISRFFVGIAIGIASFTAPLYISEISPAKYRGTLVSLNQLAITIGILLAYIVDIFFASIGAWRFMLFMGVFPAAILFIGMMFLPESPRWLYLKGFIKEAEHTLQKIRATKNVDAELGEIKQSLTQRKSWKIILQKWVRPALVVGLGLAIFQQVTGINTIIYYAPTIFEMVGFKSATIAILATTGIGLVNVISTIIALFFIDRLGRRPLLIIGLTGITLSLLTLSWVFHFESHSALLKWFAFISMISYIFCFAISLGPIMWLIISEIFPLEIRGLASSVCVAVSWAANGLIALTFLSLISSLGESVTFFIYAVLGILGLIFVIARVPETKGTTLEQIEMNLRAHVPSRQLGERAAK
jgi:SP family galactose:H+ symporter-like MFS transporter